MTNRFFFISLLAALLFAACTRDQSAEEQAIRSMCEEIAHHYPQATLQDVYKTCFQDFFGAEHLLSDTAVAHQYLKEEIETTLDQDLSAMPMYEPTGFRHRFTRVNLALVHRGEMSEDELFSRFVEAAETNNAFAGNWAEEWQRIEAIALEVHPAWADTTLQAELRYAASIPSAVRHSESFRQAYNPHYRIIVHHQPTDKPVVYMTREISPEALVRIYEALGQKAEGRVAVKISTGEAGGHNYLKPALIEQLVKQVNGTIVECNTAYPGKRNTFEAHWQTIKDHGFLDIAPVDLMDEEGDMRIPVQDTTWIKYDIVGKHLANYDFMINLAHFKGHTMGGFGGVLKNQSIGVASAAGKAYIHTAGVTDDVAICWQNKAKQDAFIESMAAAAQAVHDYFGHGERILYINVANNLSVDCDCDSHPADPEMNDIGILASLDPVALDQACVDLVFHYPSKEGDDAAALIERINSRHGIHILEQAEKIGLGSRGYQLVSIDPNR